MGVVHILHFNNEHMSSAIIRHQTPAHRLQDRDPVVVVNYGASEDVYLILPAVN